MKKVILSGLSSLIGIAAGASIVAKINEKVIIKKEKKIDKFKTYYNVLNQWLIVKGEGKSLVKYFEDNELKSIALYGMGELGNRLYEELKESNVEIKYAIDKEAGSTYSEIIVKSIDEDLEEVDAIIVTAIFDFEEVKNDLTEKVKYPIISLEDIVYAI